MNDSKQLDLKVDNSSEQYQLISWLFLKLLSVIYFSAFLSIAIQITGLVGSNGILPFGEFLDQNYQRLGVQALFYFPGLFWINSSDIALQFVAYSGCLVSIVLFFAYKSRICLIILFIFYLSIYHAGQTFLTFQWDSLLLEAGFLAIFLTASPGKLIIFLFHWLLFRLRFMSGISKLASGDPSWANLTTLSYYFETQPLPHMGAWYFHQLPEWMLQSGVILVFISELIVPFFIFLPRKFRITAAAITIFIQLLIIATSNHNWINLLTISLCLFLLDDRLIRKILPASILPVEQGVGVKAKDKGRSNNENIILPVFSVIILVTSLIVFIDLFFVKNMPRVITQSTIYVRSWGLGHGFHVFPTMQVQRHELQIEGSYDGRVWKAYKFKYKPGPLDELPVFIVPHQPRLDWMIWFVPPQHPDFSHWFNRFILKLKQGSPEVLALLDKNPFEKAPPRFIRVQVFQYKFTNASERKETGFWWKARYLGVFPNVMPRRP